MFRQQQSFYIRLQKSEQILTCSMEQSKESLVCVWGVGLDRMFTTDLMMCLFVSDQERHTPHGGEDVQQTGWAS